jgi:hypothetical protein
VGSNNKHHHLLYQPQQVSNSLADHSITTSIEEKTMVVGVRIWKEQMVAWENKTAVQQIWQNLQDYFTGKWLERRQYLQAMMLPLLCRS